MADAGKTLVSAKERYDELKPNRNSAETRAKACTKVTIPSLFVDPKQKSQTFTTPVQGTGARCANAIANALLLAVLPPNITPFTLKPDLSESDKLMQEAGIQKGELETALSEIERAVMDEIEAGAQLRSVLAEGFKHSAATGNWLLYVPDQGPGKLYPLTSYVADRDGLGNVLEIVTLDLIAIQMLPSEARDAILAKVSETERLKKLAEDAELYTRVYRDENNENWLCYQEVEGVIIAGTEGSYPIDAPPWIPVSIPRPTSEDYGRGLIEDYRGEFETLEALRKALRKGAAAAAKILWLLKPTSAMKPDQLTKAESGAVIRGDKNDISSLTLDKFQDLSFVKSEADTTARNLELVFGVGTAIQRSGDRVTREEIQYLARVLEDNRAGLYSVLGPELMVPLIRRILFRLQQNGAIPELPEGLIKPRITVGVAALGRGHDFEKLVRFGETAKGVMGEQEAGRRIDWGEWLSRLGAASDITTKGLVLDPEAVQQNDQTSAMNEAAVRAAPNLVNAAMTGGSPIQE
ncbi:phage tail protein [Xanthomonas axonopodis pv. martyniicola]|uniref:portal protein n=1 Tax=Xanthomonas axonopodis TaxID=53413 RepID=UPI000996FB0D|nr:portal protein [Xanthomonas axonopodis]OOW71903.1 phage tail protein [Xanthomonas axonopodis pv. martyniicola]OOW93492.1 phage tail protein [Xanthomonas campestris pv. vitiscarnosae]